MNLKNIEISNVIATAEKGITIVDADGIKMSNVKIDTQDANALNVYNSKNLNFKDIEFSSKFPKTIIIKGEKSANSILNSSANFDFLNKTFIDATVPKGAVNYNAIK